MQQYWSFKWDLYLKLFKFVTHDDIDVLDLDFLVSAFILLVFFIMFSRLTVVYVKNVPKLSS